MQQDHGPLPILLGLLTLVSGFIDAVTFLKFGHVFVGNMTGNIVFLGFGVGGVRGISIAGSLTALGAFLVGALGGGLLIQRFSSHRGSLLTLSTLTKVLLLAGATTAAFLGGSPLVIIPELGVVMGIQNAVARKLAVPDLTTTVLTMTLTGIMADSSLAGGTNVRIQRRIAAVATMFIGALSGAAIVLRAGVAPALLIATLITVIVSTSAYVLGRSEPDWVHAVG
jgi:uncharacterized membrane protein YoaK (UPF0700 family)